MKVTAFIGSGRKKHTYLTTEKFLKNLQILGDIDYEMVMLSDYNLKICKGCSLCLNKGEELCPLKDDRDILLDKISKSDGIVFATPNYAFHVSGLMKVFLDRFGFIFHRPRFFGKVFTSIVVEGIYGGKPIVKYLNFVGNALGTNVKGICLNSREPIDEKRQKKSDKMLIDHGKKFLKQLNRTKLPKPSLFELMIFRIGRSAIKRELNNDYRDYSYYKEMGWFESNFYYPVKLNPVMRLLGKMFDRMKM